MNGWPFKGEREAIAFLFNSILADSLMLSADLALHSREKEQKALEASPVRLSIPTGAFPSPILLQQRKRHFKLNSVSHSPKQRVSYQYNEVYCQGQNGPK